ncbi:MAG TPA: cytochrome c [Terracidiphilus sp.]
MKIRLFLISLIASSALLCAADKNTGAEVFNQMCVGCHGSDSKSKTDMGRQVHAADLTTAPVQKLTDSSLSRIVENGKENMPPFQDKLSSAEIKSVVAYVRQLARQ